MKELKTTTLFDSLAVIKDPRIDRQKRHSLINILVIALCAALCGAEGWEDFEEFGKSKREWLSTFLRLENGIPSHDTFRRVFLLLDAEELKVSYVEWIRSAVSLSKGQLVNIDGKKLRGSKSSLSGKEALTIVSAWASSQGVVLGQVKCAEKSNEITAIPQLLQILDLTGCVVTIDAMGCQKEIVEQVVEQEADYVISLKGNQGILHQEIKNYLDWAERIKFAEIEFDYCQTLEKAHGRIEQRKCWVTKAIDWLEQKEDWAGLKSVIMVEAEREIIGGAKSVERRYFISSLEANAKSALKAVRGHWAIENELHWCLDIGFREDACQIKDENAAENLAITRHLAMNLIKQEKTCRKGVKAKRLKASWDEEYLQKILNF